MRDIFDIKMILKSGYFDCFTSILKHGMEEGKSITKKTYPKYELPKVDLKEMTEKFKLTKLQVQSAHNCLD